MPQDVNAVDELAPPDLEPPDLDSLDGGSPLEFEGRQQREITCSGHGGGPPGPSGLTLPRGGATAAARSTWSTTYPRVDCEA